MKKSEVVIRSLINIFYEVTTDLQFMRNVSVIQNDGAALFSLLFTQQEFSIQVYLQLTKFWALKEGGGKNGLLL